MGYFGVDSTGDGGEGEALGEWLSGLHRERYKVVRDERDAYMNLQVFCRSNEVSRAARSIDLSGRCSRFSRLVMRWPRVIYGSRQFYEAATARNVVEIVIIDEYISYAKIVPFVAEIAVDAGNFLS